MENGKLSNISVDVKTQATQTKGFSAVFTFSGPCLFRPICHKYIFFAF